MMDAEIRLFVGPVSFVIGCSMSRGRRYSREGFAH